MRGLNDGDVVVASGSASMHNGAFDNVIFVVDDLRQSLGELVYRALEEAYNQGYTSISFPLMRTGVMAGVVEKTPMDVAV